MRHNLFNRCCHFAYGDAAMWLKCVRHPENAVFTQNFAMSATPAWGTGGHEALVCSTFHKSYKHGMNEHTGKHKVDSRYISKDNIGLGLYTCMDSIKKIVVENISQQKKVCKVPTWKRAEFFVKWTILYSFACRRDRQRWRPSLWASQRD